METKTIELGGQLYEIKLVEPQPQPEQTLPTLQEVFNKIKPAFYVNSDNGIMSIGGFDLKYSEDCQNTLSTERQCKRIQALIALQNIADYYNGEVDYRGKGYVLVKYENQFITSIEKWSEISVKFKSEEHAKAAIEILRNANLLDNL
mgnify:CR=1 FL=1